MTVTEVEDKSVTLTVKKTINITEFARKAFINLPNENLSLECEICNHDKMMFTFWDGREGKEYILTKENVERGVATFLQRCLDKKWDDPMLFDPTALLELNNWDDNTLDMAIQTCIFDEVIYEQN